MLSERWTIIYRQGVIRMGRMILMHAGFTSKSAYGSRRYNQINTSGTTRERVRLLRSSLSS